MNAASSSNGIVTSERFPKYTPDFEWKFYKSLVENYFAANAVADDSQQKKLFFAYLPTELINLISYLIKPDNLPTTSMTKILDQLSSYFDSQNTSVSLRRRNLLRRDRKEQEGIEDYAKALKAQISCCNFGLETNAHLCECFVLGLNHDELTKMLGSCSEEDFDALVKRALFLNVLLEDIKYGGVSVSNTKGGGDAVEVIDFAKDEYLACEFKDLGCNFVGSNKQMEQHVLAFSSNHLKLSHSFLKKNMEAQGELIIGQTRQINAFKQQLDLQCAAQMEQFDQQFATQKQQFVMQMKTQEGHVDLQLDAQKQHFDEQLNAQKQRVDWKLAAQKQLVDEHSNMMKVLNAGEFVWCITGIADHIKAALADSSHSVISDRFYTQHNGYCMYASLQLNYKPNEVGVFLCLAPGAYDAILDWPVNKEVTVKLNDQSKRKPKHTIANKFALVSASRQYFKYPVTEVDYRKRLGVGWSFFVTLDTLKQYYIKDDKMFISILVGNAA